MPFPDSQVREVSAFNGPWLRTDPYLLPPDKALLARNVEYNSGQVSTRFGFALAITNSFLDAPVTLANWRFPDHGIVRSLLAYYSSNNGAVKWMDLSNGGTFQFFTFTGAAGGSFVPAGGRLYFCLFTSAGLSATDPQVFSLGTTTADPLFPAPPAATVAVQEGVGSVPVSAGAKRIGFVINTRSGYTTIPAPISGGSFHPITFTASGNNPLTATVTATWRPYDLTVTPVMTTSADLNTYYLVPGATNLISAGSSTVTLNIGISDDDLAATGTPADIFANQLAGGMACSHIFAAGVRLGYIALDIASVPVAYFSEANQYQSLTADQHAVYLPNNQQPITGVQFRDSMNYLFTAHGTYSAEDNGDVPATWAVHLIDDKIGTLSPHGVDATTDGFWVASETGLWFFNGQSYGELPASYQLEPEWRLIDWSQAAIVEVHDDRQKHQVHVKAPLKIGGVSTVYDLVFDYTNGREPENINYSRNDIAGFPIGGITVAENPTTRLNEVWIASTDSSQPFMRQTNANDATPYRDNASGIASLYEFGLLPGLTSQVPREQINFHVGAHVRLAGVGQCFLKLWKPDHRSYLNPAKSPLQLSTLTEPEPLIQFLMRAEQASIQFSNIDGNGVAAPDSYFKLSYLKWYYNPGPPMR